MLRQTFFHNNQFTEKLKKHNNELHSISIKFRVGSFLMLLKTLGDILRLHVLADAEGNWMNLLSLSEAIYSKKWRGRSKIFTLGPSKVDPQLLFTIISHLSYRGAATF